MASTALRLRLAPAIGRQARPALIASATAARASAATATTARRFLSSAPATKPAIRAQSTAAAAATPAAPALTVAADHVAVSLPGSAAAPTPAVFHHVWLRDNCPCPACVHPSTRQKLHASGDIPVAIQPKSARWVRSTTPATASATAEPIMFAAKDAAAEWVLEIEWPGFAFASRGKAAGNTDAAAAAGVPEKDHTSRYPASFLRRWNYSHPSTAADLRPEGYLEPLAVPWSASDVDARGHLHVDYRDLPSLESLLATAGHTVTAAKRTGTLAERTRDLPLPAVGTVPRAVLEQVASHGLVFFHHVPTDRGEDYVETLAKRFGHALRHTFYGPSWDVKSVANSTNIAYTNLFLGLHMDLMYFEAPPGLQFLHMLRKSVRGGASLFLDMHHAWDAFVASHPRDLVDALTSTPVSYHYAHAHHAGSNDPHWLHRHHPLASGPSTAPRMFYAPPFQGPLRPAGRPDAVVPWYRAMAAWENHMRAQPMVSIDLVPGDAVLFHNRRVLHGRTAFEVGPHGEGEGGVRHLRGTYVDWDEFADRWRVAQYRK
ncbi:hypothetical protein H9P43_002253 [Blastocladiella emersonii ATCC 22665]|nr:hypothetical protein H9P43_002253 [Blastocladiella emersonii ATCC 22665]